MQDKFVIYIDSLHFDNDIGEVNNVSDSWVFTIICIFA